MKLGPLRWGRRPQELPCWRVMMVKIHDVPRREVFAHFFSSEHWISCHPVLKPGRSKNETSSPSSQSDATSKSGSSACAARPRRTNLQGAKQNYMDYCMVMYQDEVPFYPFKWPLTTKRGHLILRHPHISLDIVIYKKYHLWSFGHNMELNKIQHKLTTVSRTLPVW